MFRYSFSQCIAIYAFLIFWGRGDVSLFHGQGAARAESAHLHTAARRYRCTKETVELRDWRVSDNRTAGAIRLTSRLPVLSRVFAKRSWNQVPELSRRRRRRRGEPERHAERDAISSVRLVQLERNRRLMGLTCHAHGGPNNNSAISREWGSLKEIRANYGRLIWTVLEKKCDRNQW